MASGRMPITSGGWSERQPGNCRVAAPIWARAGPASFRQPAHLEGPATWCRWMRSKSSGFRLRPLRRNMGVLQALKYRWSPSPARTRFTALRSSTSATTSWMPTIGSPTQRLARPELRQNDFGGVLGGPIVKRQAVLLRLLRGAEGAPASGCGYVRAVLATRQNAPAAVQPLLNAFPLPNGPDLGNGTAGFSASYSNPSTLNSSGIRIDYLPWQRVTIFGRYSDAPSSLDQRAGRLLDDLQQRSGYKVPDPEPDPGEQPGDYSPVDQRVPLQLQPEPGEQLPTLDNFGGAVPPPDSLLYPSGLLLRRTPALHFYPTSIRRT
jgi:hypothetical protein